MNYKNLKPEYKRLSTMERTYCPKVRVSIQRGNPLQYLRLFFKCCYYMGIIPFHFVLDENTSKYKLKTSSSQRVFCLFVWTLCLCEEIIALRDSIHNIRYPRGHDDPLAYFDMLYTCSNILYYLTVTRTIWWKSKQFLAVVQCLYQNRTHDDVERNRRKNTKAMLCVGITFLPFIFYPVTYVTGFFLKRSSWSWMQILDHWSRNAAKAFFIDSYHSSFNFCFKLFLAILRNIFLLGYTQISATMEMLIFNCAMVLYDSVKDFGEIVKDTNRFQCSQVLREYEQLRGLSRKLNKAIGLLIFGLTLACLPYYVVNLLQFIKPSNAATFLRHLLFFTTHFGFLVLAAHVNKKAHMLEEWLITGRNYEELSPTAVSILLHDLSGRHIGFNGSGFFTVTPAFLGTIISLLLTFSIIIIQFKTSTPVTPSSGIV